MKKEKKVFHYFIERFLVFNWKKTIFLTSLAMLVCASGLFFASQIIANASAGSNQIDFEKDINMGNKKIINLAVPEQDNDAATKDYVDSAFAPEASMIWDCEIKDGDACASGQNSVYLLDNKWNVGIGNANPQYKLSVNGNALIQYGLDLEYSDIERCYTLGIRPDDDAETGISFQNASGEPKASIYFSYNDTPVNTLQIKNNANLGIAIDNSGNVGIGVVSPEYKLEVDGMAKFTGAVAVPEPTEDNHAATKGYVDEHSGGSGGADGYIGDASPNPHLAGASLNMASNRLYGYSFSMPSEGSTYFTSGNVGIGTAEPEYKLDLKLSDDLGGDKFRILNSNGEEIASINSSGKLTVLEIDPPYNIGGVTYATYGHSTTGLKEETTGKLCLQAINPKSEISNKLQTPNSDKQIYMAIIDFDKVEKGSDLWLFKEITAFGDDWDNLVVTLTPEGKANVWYEFILKENKIAVYGERALPKTGTDAYIESASNKNSFLKVSYRLVAPRFDWPQRGTNLYNGTGKGMGMFVR